eukprot:scaffold11636_cov62-Cyclotella_meneghiniana.AAC.11
MSTLNLVICWKIKERSTSNTSLHKLFDLTRKLDISKKSATDSFQSKQELTDNIQDKYKAYCYDMLQELSDFYSNAALKPSSKGVKLPKSYNVSDYCLPTNATSLRDRYVFCDKCIHVIAVIRGTRAKVHPKYYHHDLTGFDGNRNLTFNFSVDEVYFHPHECDIPASERKGRMMPKSQGGRGWLKVKEYPTDKVIDSTFYDFLGELDEITLCILLSYTRDPFDTYIRQVIEESRECHCKKM